MLTAWDQSVATMRIEAIRQQPAHADLGTRIQGAGGEPGGLDDSDGGAVRTLRKSWPSCSRPPTASGGQFDDCREPRRLTRAYLVRSDRACARGVEYSQSKGSSKDGWASAIRCICASPAGSLGNAPDTAETSQAQSPVDV